MKKLIITTVAIAFSLSAYSETDTIFLLDSVPDQHPDENTTIKTGISVWCINDYVFVRTASMEGESIIQMYRQRGDIALASREVKVPMTCPEYVEKKYDKKRMRK